MTQKKETSTTRGKNATARGKSSTSGKNATAPVEKPNFVPVNRQFRKINAVDFQLDSETFESITGFNVSESVLAEINSGNSARVERVETLWKSKGAVAKTEIEKDAYNKEASRISFVTLNIKRSEIDNIIALYNNYGPQCGSQEGLNTLNLIIQASLVISLYSAVVFKSDSTLLKNARLIFSILRGLKASSALKELIK